MLKSILNGALLLGLIVVSATANAELLVNHHGQPFEERHVRHSSHHHANHRASHRPMHHGRQYHQRHHYRSYSQHARVVISCIRMKNGQHYRVC